MNYTLLKELMKQSETECGFDPEKFAELIVRECEKVVAVEIETNNKPNIDWGWDDHEQGYVTGMRAATKFIKEHFGVEE
jgi:hypothetical protein